MRLWPGVTAPRTLTVHDDRSRRHHRTDHARVRRPVVAVETASSEPIPDAERHGGPLQLLWTWASPNIEFATVYIGVISVLFFGLNFWQAAAALLLGTALGALTQGVLSLDGPGSASRRW